MKDKIEENGIAYELVRDYYIPVLKLPDDLKKQLPSVEDIQKRIK